MPLSAEQFPVRYHNRNTTYWVSGSYPSVTDENDATFAYTVVDGSPPSEADSYLMYESPSAPPEASSVNSVEIRVRAATNIGVDDTWTLFAALKDVSRNPIGTVPAGQVVNGPGFTDFVFNVTPSGTDLGYITLGFTRSQNMGADGAELRVSRVAVVFDYTEDTVPPTDPSGLSAAEVGVRKVNLTWTPGATAGDGDVPSHEVERAPDVSGSPGTWTVVSTPGAVIYDSHLDVVDVGSIGDTFHFRVRSVDDAGNYGAYTTAVAATLTLERENVFAVSDLSGGKHIASVDGLSWTAADDWVNSAPSVYYSKWLGLYLRYDGDNHIQSSPDGAVWTTRHTTTSMAELNFADDGSSTIVAVGKTVGTGVRGVAFTSSDGMSWTEVASPPSAAQQINDVAWADARGRFMAVGEDSNVGTGAWTSPDGVTWTTRTQFDSGRTSERVVWADTLGLWVTNAYSFSATGVWVSDDDGATWTQQGDTVIAAARSFGWSTDLGVLVAGASDNIYYSTDGTTWSLAQSATGLILDIAWSAELALFVAVGQNIWTSSDGINWTQRSEPAGLDSEYVRVAAYESSGPPPVTGSAVSSLSELTQTATGSYRAPQVISVLPALTQSATGGTGLPPNTARDLFNDGHTVGAAPTGWTRMWADTSLMEDVIVEAPGMTQGRGLMTWGYRIDGSGRRLLAWTDGGLHREVDVRVRFKFERPEANGFRLFARVDPASTAGNESGAYVETRWHDEQDVLGKFLHKFYLRRYVNGAITTTQSMYVDYTPEDWVNYRLNTLDDNFRAKVWVEGEDEPAGWQLDFSWSAGTGPLQYDGYVGIGQWPEGQFLVDGISVGYNGVEAPPLPPIIAPPVDRFEPDAPAWVTAVETEPGRALVEWAPVAGADGYEVLNFDGSIVASTADHSVYLPVVASDGGAVDVHVRSYREV